MQLTLEQLCNEVLELDRKATKGPWHNFFDILKAEEALSPKHHVPKDWNICRFPHRTQDYPISHESYVINKDLLAHYRSSAPKLANACLVMLKELRVLEKWNYPRCGCDELAKTTLAEIEKIAGE